MTPAEERRAKHRAERRAAILATARRLFEEKGFRGFTMEELARAVGIAVGAVYNYFASDLEIYATLAREDLASPPEGTPSLPSRSIAVARRYMPEELAAVFR